LADLFTKVLLLKFFCVPWLLSGVYNENLSLKSQEIDQS